MRWWRAGEISLLPPWMAGSGETEEEEAVVVVVVVAFPIILVVVGFGWSDKAMLSGRG